MGSLLKRSPVKHNTYLGTGISYHVKGTLRIRMGDERSGCVALGARVPQPQSHDLHASAVCPGATSGADLTLNILKEQQVRTCWSTGFSKLVGHLAAGRPTRPTALCPSISQLLFYLVYSIFQSHTTVLIPH